MNYRPVSRLLLSLLFCIFALPKSVQSQEIFQPLTKEQLQENPHFCIPIIEQKIVNGIVVDRLVAHNCQSYLNNAFNLKAVQEQEETKRRQMENNNKLLLWQYFLPRWY